MVRGSNWITDPPYHVSHETKQAVMTKKEGALRARVEEMLVFGLAGQEDSEAVVCGDSRFQFSTSPLRPSHPTKSCKNGLYLSLSLLAPRPCPFCRRCTVGFKMRPASLARGDVCPRWCASCAGDWLHRCEGSRWDRRVQLQ